MVSAGNDYRKGHNDLTNDSMCLTTESHSVFIWDACVTMSLFGEMVSFVFLHNWNWDKEGRGKKELAFTVI